MLKIYSSFYNIFFLIFIISKKLDLWTVVLSDFLIRFGPNRLKFNEFRQNRVIC
jgi:hypothetical protein